MKNIRIANKVIGSNQPVFIIAEAGVNHNGRLSMAKKLIKKAYDCGADCVKFQTFKAERVATKKAPKANYQLLTTNKTESQLEMLKNLEMPLESFAKLKAYADQLGIIFLSTPYNFEDIDLLEKVGVDAYKVASGQIVEHAFLRMIAKTKKPVILSTGMATLAEIKKAVQVIEKAGNHKIILLQCTTNYPSRIEDANLNVISDFQKKWGPLVGYSDHTAGDECAIASVALGAVVIEKHFTLDRALPGPDHSSSIVPDELESLVKRIRNVKIALGSKKKKLTLAEKRNRKGMRRSLVAMSFIPKGKIIQEADITFKRPNTGLSPEFYDSIVGRKTLKNIEADTLLQKNMVQ